MVVTLASIFSFVARVAKLVDARDLKSLDRNVVPVRVRPRAPTTETVSGVSAIPSPPGIKHGPIAGTRNTTVFPLHLCVGASLLDGWSRLRGVGAAGVGQGNKLKKAANSLAA
jgi:hypothetical protein